MTEKRRVLIVDDDPIIRNLVDVNLKVRDFEVITAGEGNSALRQVEENNPDLVLLDVTMPGIDGIEVCRRIREKSTVPVVMLSAKVDPKSRADAVYHGASDYICKPFGIDELMSHVRSNLSSKN